MSAFVNPLALVDIGELEAYPISADERLESHYFMPWERRRWLNSDMRLRGTPECRALYFDLINISYDQSPVGTLPQSLDVLAKLLLVDAGHLRALCQLEFGPLHNWRPVDCEGEVRLAHGMVLKSLREAISRKEDNRAKNEAANRAKRLQRLRSAVSGYHTELAKNDSAILWMDEWLSKSSEYRSASRVEAAISAWSDRTLERRFGSS